MELNELKKLRRKVRRTYNTFWSGLSVIATHTMDVDALREAMNIANEALDGFGVETLRIEGGWTNSYWRDCVALYVNLGETYAPTIIYDITTDKFRVCSWGAFYESIDH